MIKKIISNIIKSFFVLYFYNQIAVNFNMIIPINYATVFILSLLDIPGLFLLVIAKYLIF